MLWKCYQPGEGKGTFERKTASIFGFLNYLSPITVHIFLFCFLGLFGMDLTMSVQEADAAVRLFLGNHFLAAERRMASHADSSIYHALGHATVLFVKAMMSFEKADMEKAMDAARFGGALAEQLRPRNSLAESFLSLLNPSRPHKEITDEEMHAELCYAELLVIRALLTFFVDESLSGFVRGACRIRNCYQSLKECHRMLLSPSLPLSAAPSSVDRSLRRQFEAGIRGGIGLFNVMLSALPARVSALLQLVGFSGHRDFGMSELVSSALMTDTLRSPLAAMVLISYHLFMAHLLDGCPPDLALCSQLLAPLVQQFPNGAIVLFLLARFHCVKGELDHAIQLYNRSIQSQNVYKQFQHICHWELVFAHIVLMHWNRAAWHAKKLLEENRWSKCVYTYLLAILVNSDRAAHKRKEAVRHLMQRVPALRRHIAGRSIPLEKFCEQRADKFLANGGEMFLPQFELLYFCNGFTMLERAPHLARPMLAHVDAEWARWCANAPTPRADNDAVAETRAMYAFVRGLCMRALGECDQARHCFMAIIESESALIASGTLAHLLPNTFCELALLQLNDSIADGAAAGPNHRAAEALLTRALAFKGYAMETRLHFRIHSIKQRIDRQMSFG